MKVYKADHGLSIVKRGQISERNLTLNFCFKYSLY